MEKENLDITEGGEDPEIEKLRQILFEKGIAFLTPYPAYEKFTTGFLQYYETKERYLEAKGMDRFKLRYEDYTHKKSIQPADPSFKVIRYKGVPYQIVTEDIGLNFNCQNVSLYLAENFPKKTFTLDEVELCYHIMSILIQKATHIECMDDEQTDFCFDDSGIREGKNNYLLLSCSSGKGRRGDVKTMFNTQIIHILCYGLDQQDNDEINWNDLPTFNLIELLEDKKKLRIFFDYWRTVPDYNSIFRILRKGLNLPKEICNLIICMSAKRYGEK